MYCQQKIRETDMSTFSADKAAFFVFNERPGKGTLRGLGIVYIVARLGLLAVFAVLVAPFIIQQLPNWFSEDMSRAELQRSLEAFSNSIQFISMIPGLFFLPFFISIYTALLRWMVHGKAGGKWLGLRFGAQELHVLVVFIAISLMIIFLAVLLVFPFVFLVSATSAMAGSDNANLMLIATILYGVFYLGAIFWFAVRISPAMALTVQRGKIQVFETFKVSKGHFWGLFLAYLVQFFILLAAGLALILATLLVSLPFLGAGLFMLNGQAPDMGNVRIYVGLAAVPFLFLMIMGTGLEYLRYAMGAGVGAALVVAKADEIAAQNPAPEKPATLAAKATAAEETTEAAPIEKPAEEKPPVENSSGDKPADDKLSEEKPAEKPSGDKSSADEPEKPS
jgi:hypothetical protein